MSEARYIYGRHPVNEALRARPREVQKLYVTGGRADRIEEMVRTAARHGIPVVNVQRRALEDLVGDVPHQGVVAAVLAFRYAEVDDMLRLARERDEAPLVVGLDQIQDPHNLGSIARAAYALGAHGIFTPKDNSCEVTPTVVKASAGAIAHLPLARITNMRRQLEELKEAGLWIVGAAAGEGRHLGEVDLTQPTVLVIGSEGHGMRRLVSETCDVLAQIPMSGQLGSLNASVAAGIFLYEAARQRRA